MFINYIDYIVTYIIIAIGICLSMSVDKRVILLGFVVVIAGLFKLYSLLY